MKYQKLPDVNRKRTQYLGTIFFFFFLQYEWTLLLQFICKEILQWQPHTAAERQSYS